MKRSCPSDDRILTDLTMPNPSYLEVYKSTASDLGRTGGCKLRLERKDASYNSHLLACPPSRRVKMASHPRRRKGRLKSNIQPENALCVIHGLGATSSTFKAFQTISTHSSHQHSLLGDKSHLVSWGRARAFKDHLQRPLNRPATAWPQAGSGK